MSQRVGFSRANYKTTVCVAKIVLEVYQSPTTSMLRAWLEELWNSRWAVCRVRVSRDCPMAAETAL